MFENAFWHAATSWRKAKDVVEHSLAVDNLTIHVVAGFLLFAVIALLLRGQRNWLPAWLTVCAIAIWNEVVDITTERWPHINEQFAEAGVDLTATLIFPTLLAILLAVRNRRRVPTAA